MADKEKENADAPEFDAHRRWKKLSAPMYDWMTNHHMVWPGLACRCGFDCVLCCSWAHHCLALSCYITHTPFCRFGPCKRIDSAKYEQTIYFSDQVRFSR